MRQFSKEDIDMLVEIRRRLKDELNVKVQLANPQLLEELVGYWSRTTDAITRSRIRVFMERMGDDWPERLKQSVKSRNESRRGRNADKSPSYLN